MYGNKAILHNFDKNPQRFLSRGISRKDIEVANIKRLHEICKIVGGC
jgi:hypothetical protein